MILEKFVDELPRPKVLKRTDEIDGKDYYEITMEVIRQKLHRDLPETELWGYDGSYPGPTIEASRDEPIFVKWINNLPIDKHLLPVDKTIHGAEPSNPEVRTVVHLHGGKVPPQSDGFAEAWFTNNCKKVGTEYKRNTYVYPNNQPAATLWYHDHALGITRLNVYAGLAGFYILRDEDEKALNLPKGRYEIPIVIQDRAIHDDGSLFYPDKPDMIDPDADYPEPSIVPEFFGNLILANGKVWPYCEVEPRLYRFRLLNGSNSRFYRIRFSEDDNMIPNWMQIGTDSGLLEKPVHLEELILAPGERADVLVDFTGLQGKEFVFLNDAKTPFPTGEDPDPDTTGQIMKFIVGDIVTDKRNNCIPNKLVELEWISPSCSDKTRKLTLEETTDSFGRLLLLLTGQRWDDPITETPVINSIETWKLINLTMDTHPIHIHLVRFQILKRRPFDVNYYKTTGKIKYTGPARYPDSNERGWKDTVRANPDEITWIIAKFEGFTGVYPWHCHILEHEDHDMMRPYKVVRKSYESQEHPYGKEEMMKKGDLDKK